MIGTFRLPPVVVAAFVAGCAREIPTPDITYFPDALELPPVAWNDTTSQWQSVSVLNQTFFTLDLSGIEVVGDGAPFLELEIPGANLQLQLRQSVSLDVRVRPPTRDERTRWSTGDYEAALRFTIGGSGRFDSQTGQPDPDAYLTEDYEVALRFSLNCDLDGDGYDSEACGLGTDCDDLLVAVRPEAREVCDGIDNDCDNGIDESCVDLDE